MNRTNVLLYAIVIVLLLFRLTRPQRITVGRMWIFAGLLILLAAFAIYGSIVLYAPPVWELFVAVVLGLAAGIPVGLFRGHHTKVSATDRHGVMQLGPSWITAAIYLGAFGARALIRVLAPPGAAGNVIGDGLIVFAIAIIGASYFAIYRKYEALDHAGTQGA